MQNALLSLEGSQFGEFITNDFFLGILITRGKYIMHFDADRNNSRGKFTMFHDLLFLTVK
jgi:hypothetical protein